MTIEVGDFIVYEGIMRDNFILREVMGETAKTYVVMNTRTLEKHRIQKFGIGKHRVFKNAAHAKLMVEELNATSRKMKDRHKEALKKHFLDYGIR